MGRPRGFVEADVVAAAAELFARRAYDGVSVDDLVGQLGIHRNSLYQTFGSKRGLYLAALRWHLEHEVRPLLARIAAAPDLTEALRRASAADGALDLLLLATAERAASDSEVAAETTRALADVDRTFVALGHDDLAAVLTATVLGLRLRARTGTADPDRTDAADRLARALIPHP